LFVPVAPSGTGVGSRVSFASTQNGCGRCEVSAETAGAGTAAEPGPGLHRRAPAVRRADGTCGGAVVTNEAVQRAPRTRAHGMPAHLLPHRRPPRPRA